MFSDIDQFGPQGPFPEIGMRPRFPGPLRSPQPGGPQSGIYPPRGPMPSDFPGPRHPGQFIELKHPPVSAIWEGALVLKINLYMNTRKK